MRKIFWNFKKKKLIRKSLIRSYHFTKSKNKRSVKTPEVRITYRMLFGVNNLVKRYAAKMKYQKWTQRAQKYAINTVKFGFIITILIMVIEF